MTLHEAQIILPWYSDRPDLCAAHLGLKTDLLDKFGGFTAVHGQGYWLNREIDEFGKPSTKYVETIEEPVRVYSIAVPWESNSTLQEIAKRARVVSNEVTVYVRYASGHVELVT